MPRERRRRVKDSERAEVELLRCATIQPWPVNKKGLRRTANRLEQQGRGFVTFDDTTGIPLFVVRAQGGTS